MKIVWVGAALVLMLAAGGASAGDLALKRVMLSSGGVAYVEYEAEIEGDAELSLDLPLDQVDDVLKSIVVFDSKGAVGSASLPGRAPLAQSFHDLPFDQQALESPASLLNALQGAEIRVGGNRPLAGKLLRVVPETVMAGGEQPVARNRVTLLTEAGLQQFVLEEADSISFADAKLQAEIGKALGEITANRAKDRRRLVLGARGAGKRLLRVGYVVGSPLWKASFRIVLPDDPKAAKAHLQGWAVLENMSGQDWSGIELTLLSGNPVSFRQAIYDAYYVTRPEVPVDVVGHILPRRDTSGADEVGSLDGKMQGDKPAEMLRMRASLPAGAAAAAPAPPPPPPSLAQSADTAEASESATSVAFRVPVPVSVASGHSAMIPIIDRDIPVERLGLYQSSVQAFHPLASLRLKNDSANGLPPGAATLYERGAGGGTYLGDAQLATLPAGESRLISFAVDEKTRISTTTDYRTSIAKASIAEGVLHLTRLSRQSVTYHLKAPPAEPRHILIEHAKPSGWRLIEPAGKPAEETPEAYRFPIDLEPGKSVDLTVAFEQPNEETLRIVDLNDDRIGAQATSQELDPKIRAAFAELGRLRRIAAAGKSAVDRLDQQIKSLDSDQARVRQNLGSADRDSDLHKRYMAKLAEQETTMEGLQAQRTKAEADRQADEKAVAEYLAKLSV
jgi:hypothetical protein